MKHANTKSTQKKRWKNTRRGFKHELILSLVDLGFSFRKAEQCVACIFSVIKQGLLRNENVDIEGFGQRYVQDLSNSNRRKWRFGKVITERARKVRFEIDRQALFQFFENDWTPHPSWDEKCRTKTKRKHKNI